MRAVLLITAKDLKARLRDRSALVIGCVVPLVLAFIFSRIFAGLGEGGGAIKLAVADLDGGPVAKVLTGEVLTSVQQKGLITLRTDASQAQARSEVAKGTAGAAIVIPPGFSASVQGGHAAELQVIGSVDAPITAAIARSIADGFTAELNRISLSVAAVQAGSPGPLSPAQLQSVVAQASAEEAPIALRDVSSESKQLDPKSFYAAGMAVFFLFFTVQFGVLGLLEERNDGTLARLLAAPVARRAVLVAKLLTSFVLGIVSMGVLVIATTLLFGASWGNPIGVGVLVVAAVLAATGVTGLVAGLARSAEEAGNWQTIVAIGLGLLGGTFFPVSQGAGVLGTLTFIAPQAWFMRGLGDLRAGDLAAVWLPALAMIAFAVVTGGIGMTRLRRLAET